MSTLVEDTTRTPASPLSDSAGMVERDSVVTTTIQPRTGWRLVDWKELWQYRDLYYFLVWRGLKVRYAQSAIGIGWAVIQPVFSMVVFSLVFGKLAKVDSDGVPYALFSLAALVPWTYFSNALTEGAQSLITNSSMISKVYFPRLILPFAAVAGKLVDFSIAMCVLALLMGWFQLQAAAAAPAAQSSHDSATSDVASGSHSNSAADIPAPWRFRPSWNLLVLPLLVLLLMLTAAGLGAWLTALAVQYRDVQHAMGFVVQLLMYAAPVVYATSTIPERLELWGHTVNPQHLYALNPLVGVIEGFRSVLLGTRSMPWAFVGIGTCSAIAIALSGVLYFRRREHLFADVA